MLFFVPAIGPAPTGASTPSTVYIWQKLTPGTRLVMAGARDSSKGSTLINLGIAPLSGTNLSSNPILASIPPGYVPLKFEAQRGRREWVIWNGDIEVSEDYRVLFAQFNDATDADSLELVQGYE